MFLWLEKIDEKMFLAFTFVGILISCILIYYSIILIDKQIKDEVIQTLNSFNYYLVIQKCMKSIFSETSGYSLHTSIKVSSQMVNNFSSFRQFNYLIKYFGLNISKESIENLLLMRKYVVKLLKKKKASDNKIFKRYITEEIPSLKLYYISPQGKSGYLVLWF